MGACLSLHSGGGRSLRPIHCIIQLSRQKNLTPRAMALGARGLTEAEEIQENDRIRYAVSSSRGYRSQMEDKHAAFLELRPTDSTSFFGVFDGHGGTVVGSETKNLTDSQLYSELEEGISSFDNCFFYGDKGYKDWADSAENCFHKCHDIDEDQISSQRFSQVWSKNQLGEGSGASGMSFLHEGSTACMVLIRENQIIVANVGDSHCILSRNGQPETSTFSPGQNLRSKEACVNHAVAKLFRRLFSTKKNKIRKKEYEISNCATFLLDDCPETFLKSYRSLIEFIRCWCRCTGQLVDVSDLYGEEREIFTTPLDGSIHLTFQKENRSPLNFSVAGRSLYLMGWRGGFHNSTFALKSDYPYINEPGQVELSFGCNYSRFKTPLADTRIGQRPIMDAFEVLHKLKGKGGIEEEKAVSIITVNILEAARFQTVFRTACQCISAQQETTLGDEGVSLVRKWSALSGKVMKYLDYRLCGKVPPDVEIMKSMKEVRIFHKSRYINGRFVYHKIPPTTPKESPPISGPGSIFPYRSSFSLVEEWSPKE